MGNPKGPVKGGASCSVQDAGDAASLGISGSLKKVGSFHLKGSYHKKNFYCANLIFWIVMGCGKDHFGWKGQTNTPN